MEQEGVLGTLLSDAENLLEDIFLSGFCSVQNTTLEKIGAYQKRFSDLGMEQGAALFGGLFSALLGRASQFDFEIGEAAERFCALEFYLENAKERLG